MTRQLLICAVIDLDGGRWFEGCWERVVASLKLGKAGNIRHSLVEGAGIATRTDRIPGTENPQITRVEADAGPDGSYTLLVGGIMEREALAESIGIAPPESDAALYAAVYRKLGDACDASIIGEYAAIQWFPQERKLRLSRSPLRAPPLHFWRQGERIVVASLPRSIFAAGAAERIDPSRIADAAIFNLGDGTGSYYAGLSRVACGSWQVHSASGEETRQWWSLDGLSKTKLESDTDCVAAITQAFHRAAHANLSDVQQPAVSLSGGLDSQATASFALEAIPENSHLRSYTSTPIAEWLPKRQADLEYDESERVRAFAAMHSRLDPQFLTGGKGALSEASERLTLLAGWPVFNAMNMHWIDAIYRQAGRDGCDAILAGDMGDAGFSFDGHGAYPAWLRRGRLGHILRELRASPDAMPLWRKAISQALMPFLSPASRRKIDVWRGRYQSPFDSWCPLDPENPVVRDAIERAAQAGHDIDLYPRTDSTKARSAIMAGTLSEGPEFALGLRLHYGIETRDLTAFRPLFELCASLPDEMFLRDGIPRWIARKVLDGRVPDAVAWGRETAIQSADYLGRVAQDRETLTERLAQSGSQSAASEMIDLERLRAYVASNQGPSSGGGRHWLRMTCAVPRGLALARFVQLVEGHNDG